MWTRLGAKRQRARDAAPVTAFLAVLHRALAWCVLMWALFNCRGFVFLFGRTLTNSGLELLLLRWFRKPVVFIYVGSDARPPWMDRISEREEARGEVEALARRIRRQRQRMRRQEQLAIATVSAGTTAQFLTQPYVDALHIGVPCDVASGPLPPPASHTVRILHSPSDPAVKGTTYIQRAVADLVAEGLDVELLCISGRPNAEVRAALRDCHLIVDQVFSDLPWSAFAAEAASLGRPTIVTGYATRWYEQNCDPSDMPPSAFVLPTELRETLRLYIENEDIRRDLGLAAYDYARLHRTPEEVAARLLTLLNGSAPTHWIRQPQDAPYVWGCGGSAENVQAAARSLVGSHGVDALGMHTTPAYVAAVDQLLTCSPGDWGP